MHAVAHSLSQYPLGTPSSFVSPEHVAMATDQAQMQQLVQLLGAKMLPKQTAVVECPKSMVGRVIGKGGETIKALQQYTGAMIQIDQSTDPTRVTIAGSPQALQLAVSMVGDIVRGTFKGFAMLRQIAISAAPQPVIPQYGQPSPVYVQGYGFVPPSQVYSPDETVPPSVMPPSLMRTSPTGPLTPPMTPLRATAANNMAGGLSSEALAALLSAQGHGAVHPGMNPALNPQAGSQDALISHLLSQLASQQRGAGPLHQMQQQAQAQAGGMPHMQQQQQQQQQEGGLDQAALQRMLSQSGIGSMPMAQQAPPSQGFTFSGAGMASQSAGGYHTNGHGLASLHGGLGMQVARAGSHQSASDYGSPPPSFTSGGRGTPVSMAGASTLSGLLQGTSGAASLLGTSLSPASSASGGSGRASPVAAAGSASPARAKANSGASTPVGGRFGAIGSAISIGAAAEDALAAKMSGVSVGSRSGSV